MVITFCLKSTSSQRRHCRTPGLQWCALLPLCAGIAGWGFGGRYEPLGYPALQGRGDQNHPAK